MSEEARPRAALETVTALRDLEHLRREFDSLQELLVAVVLSQGGEVTLDDMSIPAAGAAIAVYRDPATLKTRVTVILKKGQKHG